MSWSGFNSGLYEQIRRYAEMTDQALVELKDEMGHAGHESRERLGKLLSAIDSMRREDLSARLIWLILRDSVKMSEQEIGVLPISPLDIAPERLYGEGAWRSGSHATRPLFVVFSVPSIAC